MKDELDQQTIDILPGQPGRPRLNDLAPLTPAQKQARYRKSLKEKTSYQLYMSKSLHKKISKIAQKNDISMRALIIQALTEFVAKPR